MASVTIATWNVNGIRAREAQVLEWVAAYNPGILCLQELKASPDQIPVSLQGLDSYWNYWHGGSGGYSGVSIHLNKGVFPESPVFSHPTFDMENRIVQAELGDVVVASVYIPNGGKDYEAKMRFLHKMGLYVAELHEAGKKLILCGDMNVARTEQDVHPSQQDESVIGQREDERELFEELIAHGLEDVARKLNPDDDRMFTWWPYWKNARQRNLGWRIDYILAHETLAAGAEEAMVMREYGASDHAPVTATIPITVE